MKHSKTTLFAALFGVSLLLTTGCFGGSDTTSPSTPPQTTPSSPQQQTYPDSATTPTTPTSPSSGNTGGSTTGTTTTTPSSGGGSTSSGGGSTQTPTSPFPGVVKDAMSQYTSNPPMKLYAPTFIPQAKSGWQSVSARTWQTSGDEYNVQILQTQTPMPVNQADMRYVQILGSFTGKSYSSASEAQANIDGITGYMNLSDPDHNGSTGTVTTSTVDLGTGITGKTYVYKSPNPSAKTLNQYAGIEWQEGHWNIQVTNTNSTTLQVNAAEQVVQYLHQYLLPAPQTKGDVAVQVGADGAIDEIVTWQIGNNVYQTQTTSYAANQAIAALEMAVSMQVYQ